MRQQHAQPPDAMFVITLNGTIMAVNGWTQWTEWQDN